MSLVDFAFKVKGLFRSLIQISSLFRHFAYTDHRFFIKRTQLLSIHVHTQPCADKQEKGWMKSVHHVMKIGW